MSTRKHRTHPLLWLLLAAVLPSLAGCHRRTLYSHYEHTPLDGWEVADSLIFDVGPLPADGLFQEQVGLRISADYPFTGLTLIAEQHVMPDGRHHVDTLHARLIDPDGTIQGRGISYFQYSFLLRQVRLSQGDSLHLCIRHNMKREQLPGISDVGLTLQRLDP